MALGINEARPIGYHDKIWDGIPCTVDELGRVMSDICERDLEGEKSSNPTRCPDTWKPAPESEIDLEATKRLRFRVMVHRDLPIAFVGFRCTDRKVSDFDTDFSVAMQTWEWEKIHSFTGQHFVSKKIPIPCVSDLATKAVEGWSALVGDAIGLWNASLFNQSNLDPFTRKALDWGEQGLFDFLPVKKLFFHPEKERPQDSLQSIFEANEYIQKTIVPWAKRKKYTVIVGGYSLGGCAALHVGLKQDLHTFCIDPLWGAHHLIKGSLNPRAVAKCVSVVYKENSPINWSHEQKGRVLKVTPPPASEAKAESTGGKFNHFGHNLNLFVDHSVENRRFNQDLYPANPTDEQISTIYGVDRNLAPDIKLLREAARVFSDLSIPFQRREQLGLSYFNQVRNQEFKNGTHEEVWRLKGQPRDIPEYGRKCWENSNSFSSLQSEKATAIRNFLDRLWDQAETIRMQR